MNELWINEFRYLGPAHAEGSFLLAPLKHLQVGPVLTRFQGGRFSAGKHVIASHLDATITSTIAPLDLSHVSADAVLGAVSASIRCDSRIDDLSAAQLYLDGVTLHGEGALTIDLVAVSGKVTGDSTAKLKLERLEGHASGFALSGTTELLVSVSAHDKLQAQATLAALLGTPPLDGEPMKVRVERATLDALMSSSNLGASPAFERLIATVDVRADDARPVVRLAARYVPIIAPAVLGAGPLTASGTATVTPEYALLRLNASKLGSANLTGALVHASQKWNGAAAGRIDQHALGLQVVDSALHFQPFVGDDWLEKELNRVGIHVGPHSAAARTAARVP